MSISIGMFAASDGRNLLIADAAFGPGILKPTHHPVYRGRGAWGRLGPSTTSFVVCPALRGDRNSLPSRVRVSHPSIISIIRGASPGFCRRLVIATSFAVASACQTRGDNFDYPRVPRRAFLMLRRRVPYLLNVVIRMWLPHWHVC